jgi:hypothetical protein
MLPDFRVRQRDYLLEINRAITEELDLQRVLDRIVRVSLGFGTNGDQGFWHVRSQAPAGLGNVSLG